MLGKARVNSSRVYLERFVQEAAASMKPGDKMLDAGAGEGWYKQFFTEVHYESADFCQVNKQYGEITYVCDLGDIPVESSQYDLVLCTQVLEHIPEPQQVLRELNRILKPGGQLWLSAPLYFAEHEIPFDFYRYTQYGLQHLLDNAGFKVVTINWLEGYMGTLSYQTALAARSIRSSPKEFGGGIGGWFTATFLLGLRALFAALSIILSQIDLRYKLTSFGHCKNYTVVAIKA
jgi:ubiquinone/menaquinone biosynthesis C-methylase UbiE